MTRQDLIIITAAYEAALPPTFPYKYVKIETLDDGRVVAMGSHDLLTWIEVEREDLIEREVTL